MKMFKYKVPEAVTKALYDGDITSVNYKSREYYSLRVNACLRQGTFTEDEVNELIKSLDYLEEDFEELIPIDQTFNLLLDKLMKDVEDLDKGFTTFIEIKSSYRNTLYFKVTDVICAINDNAQEGINDNLGSHLKNKMQDNLFEYRFIRAENNDLEQVYKFYYYDENYRYNTSTGAGTLTGWMTADDIYNRSKDKTIITLNQNYRLSESFYKRTKDL